jgi:hypothetical protein
MTPGAQYAWTLLRLSARGHPGASSGERAAFDLVTNFRTGCAVDFADCFARLDGEGRYAMLVLLIEVTSGRLGLFELR